LIIFGVALKAEAALRKTHSTRIGHGYIPMVVRNSAPGSRQRTP